MAPDPDNRGGTEAPRIAAPIALHRRPEIRIPCSKKTDSRDPPFLRRPSESGQSPLVFLVS